jgi:hypothetical protein
MPESKKPSKIGKQEAREALERLRVERARGNVREWKVLTPEQERILEAGIQPDSADTSKEQTLDMLRKLAKDD